MSTYGTCVLTIVYAFSIKLSQEHECPKGFYGARCNRKCGNCIGGHVFCDVLDGFCVNGCAWGFMGHTCEKVCPPAFYGYNCESKCSANCVDPNCSPTTGRCSSRGCRSGFAGHFCTEDCPVNTYGDQCSLKCDCPLCGCDPRNGTCHVNCPDEKSFNGLKIEAAVEHDPSNEQSDTKMVCQEMEEAFRDIIDKVNKTYPVPLWPLWILIPIILLGFLARLIYEVVVLSRNNKYREHWQELYFKRQEADNTAVEQNTPAGDPRSTVAKTV